MAPYAPDVRASVAACVLVALAGALSGCASLGGVTDGTSLSRGYSNDGVLRNATPIPPRGEGYLVPQTWRLRGNTFGTDELVGLVARSAARVALEIPGSTLYVADLSPRYGGATQWHRSHQTGRDADLLFYALDEQGRPAAPPGRMRRFGDDGWTLPAEGKPRLRFDAPRTWALVRALLEDGGGTGAQYLFISIPLRAMLLAEARAQGASTELLARAEALLVQPADSAPHDDHLHLRIYCPANDRALGCRDRGPLRWSKKLYKYLALERVMPKLSRVVAIVLARPFCLVGSAASRSARL